MPINTPQRFAVIRKVSKAKAKSDRAYRRRVKEWLVDKWCAVYGYPIPATECHHSRGRAGSLKMDERFWVPVSQMGHGEIHNNPEWARRCGLLCSLGEWNTPVK